MADKQTTVILKNELLIKNNDTSGLIKNKIAFFNDLLQSTILHVQRNKQFDILGITDVNNTIETLTGISVRLNKLQPQSSDVINLLQNINNDVSAILKNYGTNKLDDLIQVCLGSNKLTSFDRAKYDLLSKYFHPTGYKIISRVKTKKNIDTFVAEQVENLDCFDVSAEQKQFHMKVYGIKVYINSSILKNNLMIYGFLDDVIVELLNNDYINKSKQEIYEHIPSDTLFQCESFVTFVESLSLKDYLIHNTYNDIYSKYIGYINNKNIIHQKKLPLLVKEFVKDDLYSKRNTIISLLIKTDNCENQYLAYLLYDLLSNEMNNGSGVDTQEQTILFDSFTLTIKQAFKHAMKRTIQYTNELTNFDFNKIPLEQQICLMKAPNSVKEKAMVKLKEVKAKSEDSGTKARQYLDGLLKIPFGVYKREPILHLISVIQKQFINLYTKYNIEGIFTDIPKKDTYTSFEIIKYMKQINSHFIEKHALNVFECLKQTILTGNTQQLQQVICVINNVYKICNMNDYILKLPINKKQMKIGIEKHIQLCYQNNTLHQETVKNIKEGDTNNDIVELTKNITAITEYLSSVRNILDASVHGHPKAKKQIERIIGQWINTRDGQIGHVLGFQGDPGVGKTTLAKGLSQCLKDENGVPRPLAFIAIGGESSASHLVGHGYTFVGSTWGQLSQKLMDAGCMNPIIVIDEVDKIAKTEHGKEIMGILTHLLDPTQNDKIQDKYFAGIDFDFSKILFILSYNDPNSIDSILLDRVHQIKFDSLTVDDKIVISKKHILPEIYKNIGLDEMIEFTDDAIEFIIKEYTLEPGVRKLKEKLFEIVGDINFDVLTNNTENIVIPFVVTIDNVKNKFFKDKREVPKFKIHQESKVGVINALWANQYSMGGPLALQASWIPSSQFLGLTLTGSMGDVMKQSISVSLTNAWNLTSTARQKELIKMYNNPNSNEVYGLHVNCPGISTSKDGPSATTAFTILLYSIFNDIKIKNYVGITGETSFDYNLTEIGGLEHKIIHSIPCGIKEFIFPVENKSDFDKMIEKYKGKEILNDIKFHCVNEIQTVFDLILEK